MVLCPSWLCYFHGSCDSLHVYICGSLHVHICYMCIARELEAIASFALQPLVSQTRYSASLLSSAMMQWNNITGTVAIHNGEALLRLAPASSSSAAPGPSETARAYGTPWGVTRDEQLMMATIVSGDVPVHAARMPMSSTSLQVILNNIQKSLQLVVGQNGGWSVIANEQFFKILAKPKRVRRELPAILQSWMRSRPPS